MEVVNEMLQSKTPENIDNLDVREITQLATENKDLPSVVVRYRYVKMLFDILGYRCSNDLLLFLLSEPKAKLCLAPAGGGKTTSANVQAILEKLARKSRKDPTKKISGTKILALVYNKHNVANFRERHKMMVAQLRSANIKGLNIDDDIQVATMHSFCDMWRREYSVECDLVGFEIVQEDQALVFMQNAFTTSALKHQWKYSAMPNIQNLYTLYTYKAESMIDYDELESNDKFQDLGMPMSILKDTFEFYDSIKRRRKRFDFVDMLTKVYQLLKNNPSVLQNIQRFYEYVIADEVQDFTPLMMELLKLFVNNGTPLLCIGDEDQSIYNFRGADIYNTLDFEKKFDGGEVYVLQENRRCSSNILAVANEIIQQNALRFNKSLKCVREGGLVEYKPYSTTEGQIYNIVKQVQEMDFTKLQNTVICCRTKEGTQLLSQALANEHIAFHIISGYTAYTHELYRHMFDVLYALWRPVDSNLQLNLYKVLPIDKKALHNILQYDSKKKRFSDLKERCHFAHIDYGSFMTYNNFKEIIVGLAGISAKINEMPMKDYVPLIFSLISKYYWNLKKRYNDNYELDEIFEKIVKKYFYSDLTFPEFINQHDKNTNFCSINQKNGRGITISTFHGLKGLEYDTVIMYNLDNDIFPNFPLIESKEYTPDVTQKLKEAERRLFYVAATRARFNLYMYYQQSNPSIFIKDLLGAKYKPAISMLDVDNIPEQQNSQESSLLTSYAFDDSEDEFSGVFEDDTDTEDAVTVASIDENSILDASSDNAIADSELEKSSTIASPKVESSFLNSVLDML